MCFYFYGETANTTHVMLIILMLHRCSCNSTNSAERPQDDADAEITKLHSIWDDVVHVFLIAPELHLEAK